MRDMSQIKPYFPFLPQEVEFMAQTVERFKPCACYDWGTNIGASALVFYEAMQEAHLEPIVCTTELPPLLAELTCEYPLGTYGVLIEGLQVSKYFGDGVLTSLSCFVKTSKRPSLFFLDGDHSYHNVYRELEMIGRIAGNSVILVHDTNGAPGAAVEEFAKGYQLDYVSSPQGMARLIPIELSE